MNVIVTGATGFVGNLIVPKLIERKHKLLLVGRDRHKLEKQFPGIDCSDYEALDLAIGNFEVILHLAANNNNNHAGRATSQSANVDLLTNLLKIARKGGVKFFINTASIHCLDLDNKSDYATTKRRGCEAVDSFEDPFYRNIYLPMVYGDVWPHKLKFLNVLPNFISSIIFTALASIKPTVNVDRLVIYLESLITKKESLERQGPRDILTDDIDRNIVYLIFRKVLDLSFAVLTLIFCWWLLVFIWFWVKYDSPGEGVFSQPRLGKNERQFICYKFRTMNSGTAQKATHEIEKSNITGSGKFLRKFRFDELAQVFNVLKGEVTLIGPRPCLKGQIQLVELRRKQGVFTVLPGLTGLSQVSGLDMSEPLKLSLVDAEYIALRSIALDLKILVKTFVHVVGGENKN